MKQIPSRRADLTFRHNLQVGRHGWLRLTPAYSVKVVQLLLEEHPEREYVLDPFSGTGTTGLVCAELGIRCDLLEINPFLTWLAKAKTANYTPEEIEATRQATKEIVSSKPDDGEYWTPPIANIERWWTANRLRLLSWLFHSIEKHLVGIPASLDLAKIAFCRCLIEWSNAAFNHQSMSFKESLGSLFDEDETHILLSEYSSRITTVLRAAEQQLPETVSIREADSKHVPQTGEVNYDCVITSPPYPNRMSYIRELRPYMYWLRFLSEPREAGELDWKAIGGTWGIATSWTAIWEPGIITPPCEELPKLVNSIRTRSPVLANYVHKYFVDMTEHFVSLRPSLSPGAQVYYVIGNSKFYDTVLPVEEMFTEMMTHVGLTNVRTAPLRKRNSKKELLEYLVSAEVP